MPDIELTGLQLKTISLLSREYSKSIRYTRVVKEVTGKLVAVTDLSYKQAASVINLYKAISTINKFGLEKPTPITPFERGEIVVHRDATDSVSGIVLGYTDNGMVEVTWGEGITWHGIHSVDNLILKKSDKNNPGNKGNPNIAFKNKHRFSNSDDTITERERIREI